MEEDTIQFDYKKTLRGFKNFFMNKKVQNILVLILLLLTLFVGASIRVQDLPHLKDVTTGKYTPLALDPYYWLRVSETLISTNGHLPLIDSFRYPGLNPGWTRELMPRATVFIYEVGHSVFNSFTLNFADVLNPVIFFILGLIAFFLLAYILTKNKWIAILSSSILIVIPPYLYRTIAGFADHDSLGMFGFFLSLLFFSFSMIYLERKKVSNYKSVGLGFLSGFLTMFAIASWGGGAKFLFMILPLAFLILWFLKKEKDELRYLLFYSLWFFGTLLSALIFNYGILEILRGFMFTPAGILSSITLGYILIDFLFKKFNILNEKFLKYKELINLGVLILLGSIFYHIFIGNVFTMLLHLIEKIINPFGTGRVGLTVAENKQPYLADWISQIGNFIFYTLLFGCFIVGKKISNGIKIKKLRNIFTGSFVIFILGILYSRISSSSIFNGENFISGAFFLISFLILLISSIYIYFKSEWKVDSRWILVAAWMIPMLLSVRSAIRVFFSIVPFVAFMVSLTIFEVGKFAKKSKEDLIKMVSYLVLVILIIGLVLALSGFYTSTMIQSKGQYPSYNTNWQKAMSWVRNNTAKDAVFLHWWDYGYWVQTGGERTTVTDGGHYDGYWDHLVARYVLTTPYPATAKSFMKIHNVSYLLIDPSDIGKYGAYSSIGNGPNISDRASYLPTFLSNPRETLENKNGTIKFYRGGFALDSDLILNKGGKNIFLPKGRAGLFALIIQKKKSKYTQPIGVFVYNNNQYRAPIRYLFSREKGLMDFGSGVNSTVYLYPSVEGNKFNLDGAAMYLSAKTMNSLVAQLYLMGDPKNEYPELKVVHKESNYPFIFYYHGFRGPLTIWYVNRSAMTNIVGRKEFMRPSGTYGEFDNLTFVK